MVSIIYKTTEGVVVQVWSEDISKAYSIMEKVAEVTDLKNVEYYKLIEGIDVIPPSLNSSQKP